jgi:hypothetical protein
MQALALSRFGIAFPFGLVDKNALWSIDSQVFA